MYTAMYLPVDLPWRDGCTYIDMSGNHHEWDAASDYDNKEKERGKVAELFIVTTEFNQMRVVGKVDPRMKWVKAGMTFKKHNIISTTEFRPGGERIDLLIIKCEVCSRVPYEGYLPISAVDANAKKFGDWLIEKYARVMDGGWYMPGKIQGVKVSGNTSEFVYGLFDKEKGRK